MKWTPTPAPEIKKRLDKIISRLGLLHITSSRIFVYKSFGSRGRAIARIWSLPKIWQHALETSPHYIVEIISERFNKLSPENQDRTLIHELMHIPKTFSGALIPHRGRSHRIDNRSVEILYQKYRQSKD